MALRVTRAITKNGHDYRVGDLLDSPTPTEVSLGRLFKWETVSDSVASLTGMSKPELVQTAESRGLDVTGLTKAEIRELLE